MKELDDLYERVTAAILRARRSEEDAEVRRKEFLAISDLEDQIASLLPADELEGALARRGAIRAAVNADDMPRAETLFSKYLKAGVPDKLAVELFALAGKEMRVIRSGDRHRALVVWEDRGGTDYALQKLWNEAEWETEFELDVRFDGCAEMRSKSGHFHMCDPRDADALANLIKVCMADAKERIG